MDIKFSNVSADYQVGPIRTKSVLDSVNLTIKSGDFTAIIGHTGAGKSSLLKAMNGLLVPIKGNIQVGQLFIDENNKNAAKMVSKRVGMVFQFPESQLFAETVEKDICFGPMNFGVPLKTAKKVARDVLTQVGLDHSILLKSPFTLSGGQMRKVAIAGILAMKPDVLILDEPGAGLDPKAKKEILTLIKSLNEVIGLTIVLVTHDMEDVAHLADNVVVMEKGTVIEHASPREVFADSGLIERLNLAVPEARRFQLRIEKEYGITFSNVCLTVDELADALIEVGLK